jgi:hypothetical protein
MSGQDDVVIVESLSEILTQANWTEMGKTVFAPLPCVVVKVLMTSDDKIYFINTCYSNHYEFLTKSGMETRCVIFFFDKDKFCVLRRLACGVCYLPMSPQICC